MSIIPGITLLPLRLTRRRPEPDAFLPPIRRDAAVCTTNDPPSIAALARRQDQPRLHTPPRPRIRATATTTAIDPAATQHATMVIAIRGMKTSQSAGFYGTNGPPAERRRGTAIAHGQRCAREP
jgi:hypothetical protein